MFQCGCGEFSCTSCDGGPLELCESCDGAGYCASCSRQTVGDETHELGACSDCDVVGPAIEAITRWGRTHRLGARTVDAALVLRSAWLDSLASETGELHELLHDRAHGGAAWELALECLVAAVTGPAPRRGRASVQRALAQLDERAGAAVREAMRRRGTGRRATVPAPAPKPERAAAPAAPVVNATRARRHKVLGRREAVDWVGEELAPAFVALANARPKKRPKRPPIPIYRRPKDVLPGRLELREEHGRHAHYLDGRRLAEGDRLDYKSGETWWPGTYTWSGNELDKPYLDYTGIQGATCPLTRDAELRWAKR